jgi:hypothetical protein
MGQVLTVAREGVGIPAGRVGWRGVSPKARLRSRVTQRKIIILFRLLQLRYHITPLGGRFGRQDFAGSQGFGE